MRTDRTGIASHRVLSSFLLIATVVAGPGIAQETRPFLMASTGIQVVPAGHGVQVIQNSSPSFPFSALATDVDVISIFPEYLGIPYFEFFFWHTPPATHPWTVQMTAMATEAKATGKPIFLQLAFTRANVVPLATDNAGVLKVSNWAIGCPNLTDWLYAAAGKAYLNYVAWMVKLFEPAYVVTMAEPNLYYGVCGKDTPSFRALLDITQQAYDIVKGVNPEIIAFPSFNLETLYGQSVNGFDQAQYDTLAGLKRDRLGLLTFPWFPGNPYALPIDYLTRVRDRNPSEPRIVITEAGWNSETVAVYFGLFNMCVDILYSDVTFQTDFLNFLIYSGYVGNFDLITWWSNRDMIAPNVLSKCYPPATPPDFLQCAGDFWCMAVNFNRAFPPPFTLAEFGEVAFKAFGAMGLRHYDGTPKGGLDVWNRYRALPRAP
jgi:hypothetical protein